ncbi:Na+/H+ antiporter NhaA [Variovorax sp. PCZ-1]|uniref:Na+/H+ antiporter NhaA n=1 Tax=Variovorax sp. PCZ-1 TaxID=2835533 RepID=UPI001BCBAE11|nr:Na+/H+ antiporter NhaA [Variovorax sp. PCZ-1]MBS7808496.1 Na+/H+ antiporter NhaA [Variovorax sp. PCZ-1]
MTLTRTFTAFFESEKVAAALLVLCTLVSLSIANSAFGPAYLSFWQISLLGLSLEHWVNDALMAIFFLLIGLELERELYVGELSDLRNALLPIVAAMGGIMVPAGIHFALNSGTPTQAGMGIPMATDIAFALGALSLLGKRVPASLKIFLAALAVMDDLGAIIVIAVFYSTQFSLVYLLAALGVFAALIVANRMRVLSLIPYLVGGLLMWFFMVKSGVHATIAGVLLAFAIPFTGRADKEDSPSHRLEHALHKPVAFIILPIFALANTGVVFDPQWREGLLSANSLGVMGGLLVGKPLGIVVFCALAVALGICRLPSQLRWPHIVGAGLLSGIGFTMSIFITNLAFADNLALINSSKMAVLFASATAGVAGVLWLLAIRPAKPQ